MSEPDPEGMRRVARPGRLARDHRNAFLTTQTTSYRAVNLYLNFGFVPYQTHASDAEGGRMMEEILQRPILPRGEGAER